MTTQTKLHTPQTDECYNVVLVPNAVLKQKAAPIETVDDAIRKQMDMMLNTMYAAQGIGIAANQVGLLNRIFVMDVKQPEESAHCCDDSGCSQNHSTYSKGEPIVMANPEIIWSSEETGPYMEGCLSLPNQYAEVIRPLEVKVKYLDYDGKPQEMHADGLAATCIQHEIDHLDGVLFVDHLSRLKRNTLIRKLTKFKKENELTDYIYL